jgi:hypothetical protein
MPSVAGYMLGPHISRGPQHIFSSTVSSNYPQDYWNPSGFKTDNFTFVCTWLYEVIPENISMCLIPANRSTGTGVSKTVGVQKFSMNPVEQNPNYSQFVDYYCIVNFTELGYSNNELGEFHHYYEAYYDNGNKTYIYDIELDSEEYFYNTSHCDIKAPFVGTDKAQILDYNFAGINTPLVPIHKGNWWNSKVIGIISETLIRFEVIYLDPIGNTPLEGYPRLILTNMETEEELVPLIMSEELSTQFSREFGEDVYSYTCILSGFNLPPGAWTFRFEAKDSNEVLTNVLYGEEKIWVMGSGMEILSGLSFTTVTAGIVPLIGYIAAIPWVNPNPVVTGIIAITTTLFSIGQLLLDFLSLASTKNTGALLGLFIGSLFSSLSILNAYKMKITRYAKFFGAFLYFGLIADIILVNLPLQLIFPEIPWEVSSTVINFIFLPLEIFLMLGTSIVCSAMMGSIPGSTGIGHIIIKGCMRILGAFQAILALMCIFSFIYQTQFNFLFQSI